MGRLFLKLGDKYLDIPEIDAAILSEPVSTTVVMAREGRRREAGTDRLYLILYGSIPYPSENPRGISKRIGTGETCRAGFHGNLFISLWDTAGGGQLFYFAYQQIDALSDAFGLAGKPADG